MRINQKDFQNLERPAWVNPRNWEIVELYQKGVSCESIGTLYELHRAQVQRILAGFLHRHRHFGLSKRAVDALEQNGCSVDRLKVDAPKALKELWLNAEFTAQIRRLTGYPPLPNRYQIIEQMLLMTKNCSTGTTSEIMKFLETLYDEVDRDFLCMVPEFVHECRRTSDSNASRTERATDRHDSLRPSAM